MIPFDTSTITVTRIENPSGTDPYDPASDHPAATTIASGIRAVVTAPRATDKLAGGTEVIFESTLRCDTVALEPGDKVADSGGLTWTVLWATQIAANGMDFTLAGVRLVTGAF